MSLSNNMTPSFMLSRTVCMIERVRSISPRASAASTRAFSADSRPAPAATVAAARRFVRIGCRLRRTLGGGERFLALLQLGDVAVDAERSAIAERLETEFDETA